MYVPWLADAARTTGYPVVEIAGWRSRGHGGMRVVEGVVGHHTATSDRAIGDYPSLGIVTNGRSDLPGPLANYGLGRSGTIYVIAAGCAYHAGASRWAGFVDLNDEFLGIEAESAGTGVWTPAQLDSYPKLVAAVLRYMSRGTDRYAGHKDVCLPIGRKPDPVGIDSAWMRQRAANPAPPPETEEEDDMITVPPGTDDHVNVIVKGKKSLYLACSWGRKVHAAQILFYGDTGPDLNGTGVGGARENITFMPNRPGPIAIPDGAAMCTIRYTADHSFAVGVA